MFTAHCIIVLAVASSILSQRVFVELADGGTSRPLLVQPMEHIHNKELPELPKPNALTKDNPETNNNKIDDSSGILSTNETISVTQTAVDDILPLSLGNKTVTGQNESPKTLNTQAPIIASTTSSKPPTTTVKMTIAPKITDTHATPSSSKIPTTTHPEQLTTEPKQDLSCHQTCLDALNATKLYSLQKLVISQGSTLTLVCELPLNPSFILEKLVWLHHPKQSLTGQCSLTSQEFIKSCEGFQTINDTKDQNGTFIRETITMTNLLVKNSGEYMCQVKVTCCHNNHEHIMSQERILNIQVQVWLTDYTVDLAVAGSVTAILAIIFLAGSYYMTRRERAHYSIITNDVQEVTPVTVLHLPLVDDQDTDSFDSNFDQQQ